MIPLNVCTKRLELRILDVSGAPLALDYYTRNKDSFEIWDAPHNPNFYTLEFQQDLLVREQELRMEGKGIRYYIFLPDQPDLIVGSVSFAHTHPSDERNCTIGYKVDKKYRKMGYGYEAVAALLPIIMKEFNVFLVEADIQPCNKPSLNLARSLGFEKNEIPISLNVGPEGELLTHWRYFYT